MDPPDSSPTCHLPSNNDCLHCTPQQEFLKFQSEEFDEALEPAFHSTSNTLQRKKLLLGTEMRRNPHRCYRQPQPLEQRLPLSGGTQSQARVGLSSASLPCLWVKLPGSLPKGPALKAQPAMLSHLHPGNVITQTGLTGISKQNWY